MPAHNHPNLHFSEDPGIMAGPLGPKGSMGDSYFSLEVSTQTVLLTDYNFHLWANMSGRGWRANFPSWFSSPDT